MPAHAFAESANELSDRWTAEWVDGIGDTGIRPAAITHLRTGLVLAVHSPTDGALAVEELTILSEEGVSPDAWIWVHADSVEDRGAVVHAAEIGAWVEFDSVALLCRMRDEGLLSRVLLSHDESTYAADRTETEPVHITVFTELLPRLKKSGFTQADVDLMITENPRRAFPIRVRKL